MLMTERLKAARNACKLTQQQLADILGIDRSTYAYYELGTLNPPPDILKMLSSVFKSDTEWLSGSFREKMLWSAPETPMLMQQRINEKKMADLTKDERALIALYRIAINNGNKDEMFRLLSDTATQFNEEFEKISDGSIVIDKDFDDEDDSEGY